MGDGFRCLWCAESPDSWFFELFDICSGGYGSVLDPLFVEACEPGSLKLVGIAGRVSDDGLVTLAEQARYTTTVMVAGIRKGMGEYRFMPVSDKVANRNNSFWSEMLKQ